MAFSGTVQIGEIDDYIGPGAECTKPVEIQKPKPGQVTRRVRRKKDGSYIGTDGKSLPKAKITLADCLACSGCVTSAETVLITQQSLEEFTSVCQKGDSRVVVTLSPQSRVSLAHRFNVAEIEIQRVLRAILMRMGVAEVRDLTPFRDLSLVEVEKEFLAHYENKKSEGPLLCSACPGFVCYSEKSKEYQDVLVPKLSKVRSPQQISGMSLKMLNPGTDIYHVTIMPCFDKKLEASRYEFQVTKDGKTVKDVDCVLATTEIEKLISEKIVSESLTELITEGFDESDFVYSHRGGGSGGYLDFIFRSVAKKMFGVDVEGPLKFKQVRNNKDFHETTLDIEGETKLRFAKAYGFRSIQNIVQRLKKRNVSYDYIEVMACPSGCLNGSAQVRYDDRELNESVLSEITAKYDSNSEFLPLGCDQHQSLFDTLSKIEPEAFRTTFRQIKKEENALTISW